MGGAGVFRDIHGKKWLTLPSGATVPWECSLFAMRRMTPAARRKVAAAMTGSPSRRIKPEADSILDGILTDRTKPR